MDNQKFNKAFKVGYVSLLVLSLLATIWYWAAASGKDCLACTLPVCEAISPNGETYFLSADSCALSYTEIQERQQAQGITIQECSQDCIDYADIYLVFSIALVVIAIILMVAMAVYSPFATRKKMSPTALVAAIFLIVSAIVGYIISSPENPGILFTGKITKFDFDILMTDTLLYATYMLLGGTVLAILSPVIIKFLRK